MWQVLPHLARQVGQAIRAAGGGKKGFDKVRKAHPSWFKNTGKRTTTKLDNRTGKPVSGPGAKGSKATSAPKAASTSRGGWNSVPANIKKKLLAGNTKGMSPEQVAKYRTLYKNRNK